MTTRGTCSLLLLAGLLGTLPLTAAGDPAKPAEPGTLTVVDAGGKEQKLKSWKFAGGTRHLSYLVPAPPPEKEPAEQPEKGPAKKGRPATQPARPAAGPEALEFREENSTTFVEGIMTLVPLDRVSALDYDNEKEVATLHVARPGKPEAGEVLTGSTRFKGINKLVLEADVDRGEQGIAEVRFLGGTPRGIKAVRFPAPRAAPPAPAGRPAVVTTADRQNKTTHKVSDLLPLYRLSSGHEQLMPLLMFKKTLRVDVSKLRKLALADSDNDDDRALIVSLKDGGDETLTLLRTIPHNGQPAELLGLLGRVPAGYKLFPIHTIAEVQFDGEEMK